MPKLKRENGKLFVEIEISGIEDLAEREPYSQWKKIGVFCSRAIEEKAKLFSPKDPDLDEIDAKIKRLQEIKSRIESSVTDQVEGVDFIPLKEVNIEDSSK